ncbi:OmpA family protein [Vitiosangium sp. GDMCC 1.1324]|uniref:OmpA family protein n=1 Tax=Vitiosangium sp. (strain GDMCC 1.1324) TaxID=2138576 RepID=UPI000D38F987|nr:OmpA family protein [Vitiosangium sp. GDMCC 1.1324]PTL75651.1 OmpA family protein [Vitiosangium sp. GDMCC 1.1324]
MKMKALCIALSLLAVPAVSLAQSPFDQLKKAASDTGKGTLEKKINAKLTDDARKNQCSFKSGTDVLEPGCDKKLKNLTNALVEAKKQLDAGGVKNYRFEVSGHTDSSGDAAKNKELSAKRAEVIVKELVSRGVPRAEIISVGRGSEQLLVKPDDTAAKKAKNRRYEIQVRL